MEIDGLPLFGDLVNTKEDLALFRKNYKSPDIYAIPNILSEEYAIT